MREFLYVDCLQLVWRVWKHAGHRSHGCYGACVPSIWLVWVGLSPSNRVPPACSVGLSSVIWWHPRSRAGTEWVGSSGSGLDTRGAWDQSLHREGRKKSQRKKLIPHTPPLIRTVVIYVGTPDEREFTTAN